MSKREITVLTQVAMLTCIVQRGKADAIVATAWAQEGRIHPNDFAIKIDQRSA